MQIISRSEAKSQGLKWYFTGKPCKYGHIDVRLVSTARCQTCFIEYHRKWREENRAKWASYGADWYERNKELRSRSQKDWYERNKEALKPLRKKWREDNREDILQYHASYRKERKARDPEYRCKLYIRDMVRRSISKANGIKDGRSFRILGYSPGELKQHIERQFTKGMSWDNYGEWHVDHIVPVAEHIKNGETDPAVINCLTNLRPMWAKENMRKSDNRTHLL